MEQLQHTQPSTEGASTPETVAIPEHVRKNIQAYEDARNNFLVCDDAFQAGNVSREQFIQAQGQLIGTQILALTSAEFPPGTQGDKKPGLYFVQAGFFSLDECRLAISSDPNRKEEIIDIRERVTIDA